MINLNLAELEARLLAQFKELPAEDIHARKAASVFNVPIEAVTQEQRNAAKELIYIDMYSYKGPAHARNVPKPV